MSLVDNEDLDRCTLTGRTDILFHLRNLVRQTEKMSVTFDAGRRSFLTVLMEVSEKEAMIYFDVAGSEETNSAFVNSERAVFIGLVGGIRTQFTVKQARMLTRGGESVFAAPLPKSLLRVQRRDAFRLRTPRAKPYFCRIRKGTPGQLDLPLHDISVGGLGVQLETQPKLVALERLPDCRLDLREGGLLTVTLEVRHLMQLQSRLEKPIWHVGFSFVDLSPLNETLIQRFMARIEAERRARAAEAAE